MTVYLAFKYEEFEEDFGGFQSHPYLIEVYNFYHDAEKTLVGGYGFIDEFDLDKSHTIPTKRTEFE